MFNTKNKAPLELDDLVQEIFNGEHEKDILPNSAFGFTKEQQANYFSNMRRYLVSDTAYSVINNSQSTYELAFLKEVEDL